MTTEKIYNYRRFLAAQDTASTANIVCYSGPSAWDGPEKPSHFVSISDCHESVRLHKTDQESMEDYIAKLSGLRTDLDAYISWLHRNSNSWGVAA